MNISDLLSKRALLTPNKIAILEPKKYPFFFKYRYKALSFINLEKRVQYFSKGLLEKGVKKEDKILVFIRPGLNFPAITFALFKIGAVPIFIDPGMGKKNLINAITKSKPKVLISVPEVFIMKLFYPKVFKTIKISICSWGFTRLLKLGKKSKKVIPSHIKKDELAAILFTSGGTGKPKGVEYTHEIFSEQTKLLQKLFNLTSDDIDMPGFPLFALFTIAMGMTSSLPDMNPSKPSKACPKKLIKNILDTKPTFVAGSPAIWENVANYCSLHNITLPSIKYLVMFGAPIPLSLHQKFKDILTSGTTYTPYGATESLPVSCISGDEILTKHAQKFKDGKGTCVGKVSPGVQVKVIKLSDSSLNNFSEVKECQNFELGEIIVKSKIVTKKYHELPEKTIESKVYEKDGTLWHRIGDVGYFDDDDNLWFCGRLNYLVETSTELLSSIQCEAIFNQHPLIKRSALIGVNKNAEIVLEPKSRKALENNQKKKIINELKNLANKYKHTKSISQYHFINSMPVDVRHNIKIDRKKLKSMAELGELQ